MSPDDREAAVVAIAIHPNSRNMEEFYEKTKVYQRHSVGKPVEWHLSTLDWMHDVSRRYISKLVFQVAFTSSNLCIRLNAQKMQFQSHF